LAWLVKLFFIPLMISWTLRNWSSALNKTIEIWQNSNSFFENFLYFFDNYLFLTIYAIILFIDVFIFAFWYMVESKYLNNKIKSVEPTILWWLVTLICYPPFNEWTEKILGWYSATFPHFANFYVHIILNSLILLSFLIYVWASIALGFKASNLTNRGIVVKWPYRFIRHPAYFSKNLARILWALPIIILSIKNLEFIKLILIISSTILRFNIYYLRARTEEEHLWTDKDYEAYKKKVKYKFIPWIF
jgi:protein-S-isoprenylcysteine O-methyltransferase Ste14